MNKKISNQKGISLISLTIAVTIMLIITGTIIYNLKDNLEIERLEQMQSDIENLQDKIAGYYAEYGTIPVKNEAEYTNITGMEDSNIISSAVDTGKFYVIDLQALENVTLNFGQDYETTKSVTDSTEINNYQNLYVINADSHNIFYPMGIDIDGEVFYTNYREEDVDKEPVQLRYYDGVRIPDGFYYAGGTKEEGLVISDVPGDDLENTKQGNQFVWVPVENYEEEFVRRAGYRDGVLQNMTSYAEVNAVGINSNIIESTETQEEAKAMYASVKANGGFYIGRFETGTTATSGTGIRGNAVSKKGANVYNNIGWNNDTVNNSITMETGGAVEIARNFDTANGYTSVTSTLCYGVQWDTALNFIDPGYNGYAKDSTGMGWYNDNYNSTTNGNIGTNENYITGKDLIYDDNPTVIANKHKNIYDMAGNVWEWTKETDKEVNRVFRGGGKDTTGNGDIYPSSTRSYGHTSHEYYTLGFRITLFINDTEEKWSPVYDKNGVYTDKNEDTAIIPAGFKVSQTPGMDTINDGLVIQDKQGNEFVWIPVSKENFETEFVRRAGYRDGTLQNIENFEEVDSTGTNEKITETEETQLEAQRMYASVKVNEGFYIGRYEAGKDDEGSVVIKKGADLYNWIGWNNDTTNNDITVETGGAVELARKFDTNNSYTSVTSTLCYGVQWDTALNFIDPGYIGYAKDSTEMGWYSDNYNITANGNIESNEELITGKDLIYNNKSTIIANKHKNIYDMGGNAYEWTMESNKTTMRVGRGGSCIRLGEEFPASYRSPNIPTNNYDNLGFRIALYINDNISEDDFITPPEEDDTV